MPWLHSLRQPNRWSSHAISHASDVGAARRHMAVQLEGRPGLTAVASLVVTELATNLVRYARGGRIVQGPGVLPGTWTVFAIDQGPGLSEFPDALTDGWSSRQSMGSGLGSVVRAATQFDIDGVGRTLIFAGLGARIPGVAVCLPRRGNQASGDAWVVRQHPWGVRLALFDGAGSGPPAALSARTAGREVLRASQDHPLEQIVHAVHRGLQSHARPAAGIVVDVRQDVVRAVNIGMPAAKILQGQTREQSSEAEPTVRHLEPSEGLLGRALPRLAAVTRQRRRGDLLVIHSDGCQLPPLPSGIGFAIAAASAVLDAPPSDDRTVLAFDLDAFTSRRDDS